MPDRETMIDYIVDKLNGATNADVEAVYWMIVMELGA